MKSKLKWLKYLSLFLVVVTMAVLMTPSYVGAADPVVTTSPLYDLTYQAKYGYYTCVIYGDVAGTVNVITYFEFGLSDSYGTVVRARGVRGTGDFSARIRVVPGVKYYYRAYATAGGSTYYGDGEVVIPDAERAIILSVDDDVLPEDDDTYDLGSDTKGWKDIYSSSLTEGRIPIVGADGLITDSASYTVDGSPDTDIATLDKLGALGATAWVIDSNAPASIKAYATRLQDAGYPVWVCDGTADDVQWNAAISAHTPLNGERYIIDGLGGIFTLASNVVLPSNCFLCNACFAIADNSDADGIVTEDFATLTGSNKWLTSDGVPWGFGLINIIVDGNKDNMSSGYGIKIYGKGYIVHNVTVFNCKEVGYYSECANASGQTDWTDMPETQISYLKVRACDGNNIVYRGPHDGHLDEIYTALSGGYGFINEVSAGHYNGMCYLGHLHSYSNTGNGAYFGALTYGEGIITSENNYADDIIIAKELCVFDTLQCYTERAGTNAIQVQVNGTKINTLDVEGDYDGYGYKVFSNYNVNVVDKIYIINCDTAGAIIDGNRNQILGGYIGNCNKNLIMGDSQAVSGCNVNVQLGKTLTGGGDRIYISYHASNYGNKIWSFVYSGAGETLFSGVAGAGDNLHIYDGYTDKRVSYPMCQITKTIDHANIIDDGGASGHVDFDDSVVAGCKLIGASITISEAFKDTVGNNSEVKIMVGDGTDDDRWYKTASPGDDIWNSTTAFYWGEDEFQGVVVTSAAKTPRITFTADSDITDLISGTGAQGTMVIKITYIKI